MGPWKRFLDNESAVTAVIDAMLAGSVPETPMLFASKARNPEFVASDVGSEPEIPLHK